MTTYFPTVPVDIISAGKLVKCSVDGISVLLALGHAGEIFAFENNCSHADKPLESGRWNPETHELTCPFHRAVFDVASGGIVKVGPAVIALQVFPVEVRERAGQKLVFVGIDSEE